MGTDLVSAIMPMYNTARYVGEAIQSVLRQDYPHVELIVVDDGSSDGGHRVVQGYSDPRVRLMRTENRGPSTARNLGVDESRGIKLTCLDSDDLLARRSLSSRLTALLQTGIEVGFSRNVRACDISTETLPIDIHHEEVPAHYGRPGQAES
jgi:glycosyltransferase involved in cell wall biosynthesis